MILKDDPKAYAIMGCAMRVHSIPGYGFLESAYGDALEIEFKKAGNPHTLRPAPQLRPSPTPVRHLRPRQAPFGFRYRNCGYAADKRHPIPIRK